MTPIYFLRLSSAELYTRHFTETAGQDSMGFGNIAWLDESFTCLDSVQLEFWPVAG